MKNDDTAQRIQDMQMVLHGIRARLHTGSANDAKLAASQIAELTFLMEKLLALNSVDFYSLSIARTLAAMNEPKAAIDRLYSILLWREVKLK